MKQAIVCLSHMRHDLLGKVFDILNGYEVDVFQSVDDGFEQLWQDGSDVEIVLLQMTEHHVQELWDTALNWPEIRFIAVFVEEENLLLRPLHNMSIIVSAKPQLLVETCDQRVRAESMTAWPHYRSVRTTDAETRTRACRHGAGPPTDHVSRRVTR